MRSRLLMGFILWEAVVVVEGRALAQPLQREEDIDEFLKMDAEILKLPKPFPAAKVFDFTLQREVNQELGIKQ